MLEFELNSAAGNVIRVFAGFQGPSPRRVFDYRQRFSNYLTQLIIEDVKENGISYEVTL